MEAIQDPIILGNISVVDHHKVTNELFNTLSNIHIDGYMESRSIGGKEFSYLSWATAWSFFARHAPDAQYVADDTLITGDSKKGYMVHTQITANGITHKMWLPVLDGANKPMKDESYSYFVKIYDKSAYGGKGGYREHYSDNPEEVKKATKWVEAISIFDISNTLMRCLVKNMAMFGLGLDLYAGQDLPKMEDEEPKKEESKKEEPKPKKELEYAGLAECCEVRDLIADNMELFKEIMPDDAKRADIINKASTGKLTKTGYEFLISKLKI